MKQPLFLVFEGIDGSGTTTQARRLYDRLHRDGHRPILTREPGGTPLAERIRALVLDPEAGQVDNITELLLYGASRRQHVTELIAPTLASGKPVISDRYASSTVAYQGVGRGLGVELATVVNDIAIGATTPDTTICLDLSVEHASERRRNRGGIVDRLEQAGDSLQQSVRDAYLAMAQADPERWYVLDAVAEAERLHQDIWTYLNNRYPNFPYR
ncbi:MAG: dTMP kinase [Gemmatimonadetes bacterium]|nr:dTMP kinase [Gemmatimonadota bacterium]MBT6145937.1 dTMP kinase [Gemmatimonadota bacterium]MBT7864550.1 dTMP kinase [Gemmatimonadota bacterium]